MKNTRPIPGSNGHAARARRPSRLAPLALFGAVALASCSSMLGVDDYKDATAELCDLVSACYGYPGCETHVGPALDEASPAARSEWLASVSDEACLAQCSATRRCLNIAPVCAAEGETCSRVEECCGFLGGTRGCAKTAAHPDQDVCCRAKGSDCTKNEDCCGTEQCDPRTNTCGGEVCAAVGQLCQNDFNCCSGLCQNNQCAESLCTKFGDVCAAGDVCCDDASCLNGRCGYGACRGEMEACVKGDPAKDCCSDLFCITDPTNPNTTGGICHNQQCGPVGAPCATTADCCENDGLACDPYKKRCGKLCLGTGKSCTENYECCSGTCDNGACTCSLGACAGGENDCCADVGATKTPCNKGVCGPKCNLPTCDHSVCSQGAPMNADECATNAERLPIVTAVCAKDDYCCCVKWDDLCVETAYSIKNVCP